MTSGDTLAVDETSKTADPRGPLGSLFRDLRTSASGLSGREAQRRLLVVDQSCQVQGGTRHRAVVAAAAAKSLIDRWR
jgi:hypothetical protein